MHACVHPVPAPVALGSSHPTFVPGQYPADNIGSVLFEVKAKGPLWVGVVGRNFNPEGAWWEQDFFQVKPKNEKSQLITACKSTDGVIFVNGMNQAKGIPFGNASHPRIQMEVRLPNRAGQMWPPFFCSCTHHVPHSCHYLPHRSIRMRTP